MGLRCLIGHDYGEPQTSRDRSQQGNEVVVTVQEYRECTRCGHRRILSENKEVTADPGEPAEDQASAEAEWTETDDDRSTAESFTRSSVEAAVGGQEESMTAAEDDGIILEDEPEPATRDHGAWPEAEQEDEAAGAAESEHDPWPDEEPAEPEEPEPPTSGGQEGGGGPDGADDAASTGAATEPQPDRSTPRPDNRNTEFVCPDCGETWPSRNASLRPGDICPSCRQGYLDEQVVQ